MKETKITRISARTSEKIKKLCLFSCLLASTLAVDAQNKTVKGSVVDKNGETIIGASVRIKGAKQGTITDMDGKFSLPNVPENATLEISFIGYESQSVAVGGKNTLSVILQDNTRNLDELVVVGYGVQKKSDVTGSLSRVGTEELKAMPVRNALEGMQGKMAGVDITSSQRPGESGGINIRGVRSLTASQSPLYVVDGMIIQNGGIENLNPSDIESIDVLKDASATAIYGSRGANGVILVTTKKGKKGKVTLNYSGTVTVETLHNVMEMMSASEWLDYARLAKFNMGAYGKGMETLTPNYEEDKRVFGTVAASWANIEKAWSNGTYDPSKVGSYDWMSHGKQTGITTEHTLSASGGTEKFQGYASFGYLHQKGTQPGQNYTRYTLNTSFDAEPLKYFKMGASINASYSDQDYGYSFSKSVTGAGDFYSALRGMLPWTVPFDENGDYIRNPNGDVNIINPINELQYNTNQRRTFRANASLYGQLDFGKIWEPLEGLSYRIQFGPEFRYYTLGIANAADGINGDGSNKGQYSNTQNRAWTLDNLVYYNKTIAKAHNIGLTLMQSASAYHVESDDIRGNKLATPEELWYNLGSAGSNGSFGTGMSETQLASYMVRLNYGFKERYLLTASMRWDGASQLSPGHKWASFPSMALAWRIEQEKFMKELTWIDQLKLRVGVGVTGNAAISAYATQGAIQGSYYHWGDAFSQGYLPSDASSKSPNQMANQKLGWERTTQWNFGLDYSFLHSRLSGSIDYYRTKTDDLLMAMTIPSLTGYTSTMANVGKTSGWGVDIQLNAVPVKTRDFTWTSSVTWSLDRSKIDELANGRSEDVNNRWFVGKEIGVYYDYVYDGIWKTSEANEAEKYGRKPGQIRVKDLNNDGKIDTSNDRQIVGYSRPRWTGGWTNTFTYKNLELSVFLVSRWGFKIPQGAASLDGKFMMRKLDYWVAGTNEDAEYYSPGSNGEGSDAYASSMNYQDGSFIKVRNISLGYNFTANQLKKVGLNTLKVYVQAMNPFSIYKACDWLDTDLVNYDNSTRTFGSPTTIKSFVVGLNIGF